MAAHTNIQVACWDFDVVLTCAWHLPISSQLPSSLNLDNTPTINPNSEPMSASTVADPPSVHHTPNPWLAPTICATWPRITATVSVTICSVSSIDWESASVKTTNAGAEEEREEEEEEESTVSRS